MTVQNGIVSLTGFVRSYTERYEAEAETKRVAGVVGLANDLEVRIPSADERPARIQRLETFRRNAEVDANSITVETRGPEVILKGTVWSWIEREEQNGPPGRHPASLRWRTASQLATEGARESSAPCEAII